MASNVRRVLISMALAGTVLGGVGLTHVWAASSSTASPSKGTTSSRNSTTTGHHCPNDRSNGSSPSSTASA